MRSFAIDRQQIYGLKKFDDPDWGAVASTLLVTSQHKEIAGNANFCGTDVSVH
jgi:hypothetical protein